ncbi:lipopolysaccharide core heptose(II)-phosphate phosphatase (plasmid) [Escherichia coli]|uniref:lipopolysaccharide core heptose(II)-phosphate phosphatase n=1 Tax=Escherichia coli TaxID=562 RepID=UPI0023DA3113|nr:lipopolysaccharide core heptose(II)-phosphate phosphatase [Escherichia coli]WEP43343.1 lipopolysaccharide core heptose(II)-phosphate phosphatase [Escherichia coli]
MSVCLLKKCISFVLLVLTILMIFVAMKKPTELHEKEVKELNKERPLIFLIRHSERCDRTEAQCLSDKKGITVRGALKARQYGERFNNLFTEYVPYSSDTVRTKQTATYFSEKKTRVLSALSDCDESIYKTIKKIASDNKNTVIFTHNHCLTFIAKNLRNWKYKPDYLDTLVMHVQDGRFYLDGRLTPLHH